MAALLRQCRVVDHQNGVVTADKPVRLNKKFRFQRCRIPHASRGKMMQLIVLAGDQPLRHRLNALPLARSDQSRNVEWAHPSSGLVRQAAQKWLQPALKLRGPIELRAHRDRPPKSRSPRNHRLADSGIPKVMPSRTICQSSASFWLLLLFRTALGIGMGAEWPAG